MKMGRKLALVAFAAMLGSGAQADPSVITVTAELSGGTPPNEFEDSITGDHKFGASDTFDSQAFPNLGFEVDVSSGPSDLPGFDWELTMDFSDFSVVDFDPGTVTYTLDGIKDPGTDRPINQVEIRSGLGAPMAGDVTFDAGNIMIQSTIADLRGGDDVIAIHWAQVPEPATLGLMVLGGWTLIGRRHRRRR